MDTNTSAAILFICLTVALFLMSQCITDQNNVINTKFNKCMNKCPTWHKGGQECVTLCYDKEIERQKTYCPG